MIFRPAKFQTLPKLASRLLNFSLEMAVQENCWGKIIKETLNFGREDNSFNYKKIDIKDYKEKYSNFTESSHVLIYCRTNSEFKGFQKKATILMQMRCDGYIGFPGGFVDDGENPVEAVCRELKEELNWSEKKGAVSASDHQFSHVDEKSKSIFHFYTTEVTESKMNEIESNMTGAADYGEEVLGHFRVPLYVMGDAFRGFPSFLKNHFIGNAKLQLLQSLLNLNLVNDEQIIQALNSAPMITF